MADSTERDFTDPWGFKCGPLYQLVGDQSLNGGGLESDSNLIENYVGEHLQAGGALVRVFKLLGIHEQGRMVDLVGNGRPISSGDTNNFPASDVFDLLACNGWKSVERGPSVIKGAFIGYDFGPLSSCGEPVYGIDTSVSHMINTIKLQQGTHARNRATRVRVERSVTGAVWYGVDIITLIDDDEMHEYPLKRTAESRYWRLRPVEFNGGTNDTWHVMNLQLFDYQHTRLDNIQDEYGFLEARDRDYASESVEMKCFYDLMDMHTELTKFGIDMSSQAFTLTVSFKDSIRLLGRPLVIGDILELPSEVQYSANLTSIKKYLEVTDVSWSINGYTPHWRPTLQTIVANPMMATQETLDIIGDFSTTPDSTGFLDINTTNIQDMTDVSHQIFAKADDKLPERGSQPYEVAIIPDEVLDTYSQQGIDLSKLNYNQRGLYQEDGMPKNGEPFTTGDVFPTNPANNAYHRLTYSALNDNIPPRLFKWSAAKNRWIFNETDRRAEYNKIKPSLQATLRSPTAKPIDKISKKDYE